MKKLFASLLLLTLAVALSVPSFAQDTASGEKKDAKKSDTGKTKGKAKAKSGDTDTTKTDASSKDAAKTKGKAKAKGKAKTEAPKA